MGGAALDVDIFERVSWQQTLRFFFLCAACCRQSGKKRGECAPRKSVVAIDGLA